MGSVLPTTGITRTIVANALGTSSTGVSSLCTHSSINMWSKYKPVVNDGVCYEFDTNWWKSVNGNCASDMDGTNIKIWVSLHNGLYISSSSVITQDF